MDRKYYNIYIEQWRDIAMLRLFEVFIESAPQLVLQLYILAYNRHFDKEKDWLTACSACFSLISLSTSIVSYSKALRDASVDKGIVLLIFLDVFFGFVSLSNYTQVIPDE